MQCDFNYIMTHKISKLASISLKEICKTTTDIEKRVHCKWGRIF
jgi:hypothetical protein